MFTYASRALGAAKGSPVPPAGVDDPNYAKVSLLMYGNGVDNGTLFIEEKAHAITRIGNTVTSVTQSKFDGSSLFFDGSSALSADNADLALGAGDFTIEFWVYQTARGNPSAVFGVSNSVGALGMIVQIGNTGTITLTSASAGINTGTAVVPLNQWAHVAISRASGTLRTFVNGTQDQSFANSTNFTDTQCYIGRYAGGGQFLSGYMDDIRLTVGAGRYTAAFTPPTASFPNVGPFDVQYFNRTMVAHFDGANGSTVLTDNSSTPHTMSAAGSAAISTFSKFGGSLLLTGGTDRANVAAASTDFSPGTGDFAVEAWVNVTADVANGTVAATNSTGGAQAGTWWFEFSFTRGFAFIAGTSTFTQAYSFTNNTWVHIMVQRISGQLSFWANGQQVGADQACAVDMNASTSMAIGGLNHAGPAQAFRGYIDEFRFSKGVARTTAPFTPQSGPYANMGIPEPSVPFGLVSMLLHMDGANGGTTFTDQKGHTMTRVGLDGGPVTSTAQSKFGGASGLFVQAQQQYLSTPNAAEFAFGTGDFIVEGWVYLNSVGAVVNIAGNVHGNDGNVTWAMRVDATNHVQFYGWTSLYVTGATALAAGQWYHLAVSRVGATVYVFVNGKLDGSASAASINLTGTGGAGMYVGFNEGYLNGYIDDLRIVKGQGISSSFSPPTSPYPNS